MADPEAVVVVPDRADRDLEVEVLVARIRMCLAQVPGFARGAQQRSSHGEVDQRLPVYDACAAQALEEDLVLLEQVGVLVGARRHDLEELARLLLEAPR